MSTCLWRLWSPEWSFRTGETVVFRWQIGAVRRCFKMRHWEAVDLSSGIGTVQLSVVMQRRNSCRKWLMEFADDGRSWWFQWRVACICSGCCYCVLSTTNKPLRSHSNLQADYTALNFLYGGYLRSSRLFLVRFLTRMWWWTHVSSPVTLQLQKFEVNNEFLLVEWSRQAVRCCTELIRESQVTFLLHSEFSVF